LLHPDGVSLHEIDPSDLGKINGIAAIDCIWRRLAPIVTGLTKVPPLLVRIPPGFRTAYPRRSRVSDDPESGLATIEALFIAAAFCQVWDLTLLREYWFGSTFIESNIQIFKDYSISVPEAPSLSIYDPRFPAHSRTRREARGRPACPAALTQVF